MYVRIANIPKTKEVLLIPRTSLVNIYANSHSSITFFSIQLIFGTFFSLASRAVAYTPSANFQLNSTLATSIRTTDPTTTPFTLRAESTMVDVVALYADGSGKSNPPMDTNAAIEGTSIGALGALSRNDKPGYP